MPDLDEPSSRRPKRVAVIHNIDFEGQGTPTSGPGLFSLAADAEVARTARHIADMLEDAGLETVLLQVNDSLAGLLPRLREERIDVVFNLVETLGGEAAREAELPMMLEAAGIPFTGNGAAALQLAHAKDRSKQLLAAHRLPTPRGICVRSPRDLPRDAAGLPPFPLFIKPARVDASIGIGQQSLVRDRDELKRQATWLHRHVPGPMLIEEYLPGPEINVAIFPNPFTGRAVPTIIDFSACPPELVPIVTYDCKWLPESPEYAARSTPCVDQLAPELRRDVLRIARAAFLVVGGASYGRVDLRLDRDGRPKIMDINPNPDLDHEAGLSVAANSVGLDYQTLLLQITDDALRKQADVSASYLAKRSRAFGRFAAAY
ncbi:MAG TPA: hypothetical protein PKW95_07685 [bacterium]|nr:hypothetical protein [bacterium]